MPIPLADEAGQLPIGTGKSPAFGVQAVVGRVSGQR